MLLVCFAEKFSQGRIERTTSPQRRFTGEKNDNLKSETIADHTVATLRPVRRNRRKKISDTYTIANGQTGSEDIEKELLTESSQYSSVCEDERCAAALRREI